MEKNTVSETSSSASKKKPYAVEKRLFRSSNYVVHSHLVGPVTSEGLLHMSTISEEWWVVRDNRGTQKKICPIIWGALGLNLGIYNTGSLWIDINLNFTPLNNIT